MEKYTVRIVREPGSDPVTGHFYDRAEETFDVYAISLTHAYKQANLTSKLKFRGQTRRLYINGVEYFNEKL